MRALHLTNAAGRDATVQFIQLPAPKLPKLGVVGKEVRFTRFLAAGETGLHSALQATFGEDYGDALLKGDPEIDLERVGQRIERTDTIYLSADGEVLHAPPALVEVIFGPDGQERSRRAPQDVESNINEERPVRWTGRKMKREEAIRRFVFKRTLQIRHADGLTFDFLFEMAKSLHDESTLIMLGAGDGGKQPLILQQNGTPYRAFLEGRIDGNRYQLLLHLSNMELKRPAAGGE